MAPERAAEAETALIKYQTIEKTEEFEHKSQIKKTIDLLEGKLSEGKLGEIKRRHEATLIKQKIDYIKRGYRMG